MLNYIYYFLGQLFLVLLTCKLCDVSIMKTISWFVIFIPLGIMILLPLVLITIGIVLNLYIKYKKSKKKILKG
jgi:hypothetical protein